MLPVYNFSNHVQLRFKSSRDNYNVLFNTNSYILGGSIVNPVLEAVPLIEAVPQLCNFYICLELNRGQTCYYLK